MPRGGISSFHLTGTAKLCFMCGCGRGLWIPLTESSMIESQKGTAMNPRHMTSTFSPAFIDFLKRPETYPHRPDRVKHIQTHISHVFIASPFVYKFKKPVNFDFLDFSTLEKRKYYCEQEVELNSRLCGGSYLGVIPIYNQGESWSFDPEKNKDPVEYCVWMNQLPHEHFLIEYVRRGRLTFDHLDRVVSRLIPFYSNQESNSDIRQWGRPERIKTNTDENFNQTAPFIGATIDRVAFDTIRWYTDRYLEQNRNLFEKRIRESRIVDGHGDLHLEHIHMTDERICIYDCIEFNDRFRYQDIASDISFLAMDLDFNGLRNESRYFAEQMAEKLDDPELLQIIHFYKCYRAYIRGKVKSMESREEEVEAPGRDQAARLASRYFSLALGYALFGSRPAVLVLMGQVASGKSTLAGQAAEMLNINRYSSDSVRKKLAGLPLAERASESDRNRIYRDDMTEQTYKMLIDSAKAEVSRGKSVVIDATFGNPGNRHNLISELEPIDTNIYFVETHASAEIRKQRLADRIRQKNVISDARMEDADVLDRMYHPPDEIDTECLYRIDTAKSLNRSVEELFLLLSERNKSAE